MNMPSEGIVRPIEFSDIPLPAAGPGSELLVILTSCNERLQDLQRQATDIVFSEVAVVQSAWLRAVVAVAEAAPQKTDGDNVRRMVEVVNDWFQAVAQAQTAVINLLGKSVAAAEHSATPPVDRRQKAVVINFPDRRRAA
jgi:hypothetical protein